MARAATSLLLFACCATGDVGYELLFQDALDEADARPLKFKGAVPTYLNGAMVQTGPGRWTWGNRSMTHALDGYGKLHLWEFAGDGSVLFSSKFLQSRFLTESRKADDIVFTVLAQPTDPPLKSPGITKMTSIPADNNQVNVVTVGNRTMVTTDTVSMMEIDRSSLATTHEYNSMACGDDAPFPCEKLQMKKSSLVRHMCVGGSAHPWTAQTTTAAGDYVGLREEAKLTGAGDLPGKEHLHVYRVSAANPDVVDDVLTIDVHKASYTHSFGLTVNDSGSHVVIAQQPVHYKALGIATQGTLKTGLVRGTGPTQFYVAPVEKGAKAKQIEAPGRLFFGHFVNAYSPAPGKFVADINAQDDIFFDRYDLGVQRSKAARDAWPTQQTGNDGVAHGYQTVTRYEIDADAGTATATPLFGHPSAANIFNEHDLFRLHPADYGRPYCGYWAWQAYYNSTAFASWAVVRAEICGAKPVVAAAWYRPNVYPGEATFVPAPGSADKTEGVLLFKALDGNTGKSLFVIADAHTLDTIAEAELPVHIPFTVHGNWFPAH